MNEDDISKILDRLKCVGMKATRLDRYIIAKAWGIYYAIWALSILLFSGLPYLFYLIKQPFIQTVAFLVSYLVIIVSASYITGLVFSKAARLSKLNSVLKMDSKREPERNSWIGLSIFIAIIIAIVIIGSDVLLNSIGSLVAAAIFILIAIYVYSMIKKSLGRVPLEGLIAVSAFIFSAVGGWLSVLIFHSSEYYGDFWIPTIITWFLASFISLFNATNAISDADTQEGCN
ncbi:hypothetical protein OXIME_000366 [Oxyplasma meridianum]|uniref:Uncharacterized protein n=1 Tax=Oxyplasma meridianum TaxID=3073602 RepID=A0AAX4NF56_9ARCH